MQPNLNDRTLFFVLSVEDKKIMLVDLIPNYNINMKYFNI